MKVVTTPSIPTVATTVRIQSPLPASATTADSNNSNVSTVQLVPSTNVTAAPAVRLSTPTRPIVRTIPATKPTASSTSVRSASTFPAPAKSAASSAAKNNFVSKSPMLSSINKQQTPSSQSKSVAKERDRKNAVANAAAAATATAATALAAGYV